MSLLPSKFIEAIDGRSKTEMINTPKSSFLNSIFLKNPLEYTDRIEIHGLMRRLREKADYEERIGVLELVWMVVLSDNRLDHIEAQLMRRLAGLLYISDVDSGLAAQTARTRLGIDAASA